MHASRRTGVSPRARAPPRQAVLPAGSSKVTRALDRNLLLQIGHSLAGRLWLEISLTRQRKADGWSFATPAANSTGILPDPQGGKRDITVKNEGNTL